MNGFGSSTDRLPTWQAWFMLATGPLAWLAQLCIGFAMTSWTCFPRDMPRTAVGSGATIAAIALLVLCALLALVAALFSWRKFAEARHGRTRFLALWGMLLGSGFALTTLLTLFGFLMVRPCVV